MNQKELKQKLKNPDFKEGYDLAELIWRKRMLAAVEKANRETQEYRQATFNLFRQCMDLKYPEGWR